MNIGVDLDGVVTVFSGLISAKINWPWQMLHFLIFERPQKRMISLLRRWKEDGNEIVIVSARPKRLENLTRKWLRKHNIPFDKILFVEPGKDIKKRKLEIIKQIGIEMFIDNEKETVAFLKENNIQVKFPKELETI